MYFITLSFNDLNLEKMKKLLLLLALVLFANIGFAQSCKKTCDMKNSYVQNGDLIEATLYHDNGKVAQTGFYTLENKLEGEWISYDAKGNKTAVAYYDSGQKVGKWVFYNGDEMKEVVYSNSKIAEVKTWKNTETRVVSN